MQKSSLANCTDMNDNNITELEKFKNKLEEIPLADIREIVDELNRKLNAFEEAFEKIVDEIED